MEILLTSFLANLTTVFISSSFLRVCVCGGGGGGGGERAGDNIHRVFFNQILQ